MFLGEDLEVWTAFKRIWILASPFYLIWGFSFITYTLTMIFPLFTFPLIFTVPTTYWLEYGPMVPPFIILNVEVHTFAIRVTTLLEFHEYTLILFTTNSTLEFLLLAITIGCLPPIAVISTYSWLLLRLSKDGKFSIFSFMWRLPNSKRYKNYGEAKGRIKHLIRKGALREKMAIFAWSACYIGFCLYIVIFYVGLLVILLPDLYQWNSFILLPILVALIASQRFLWNTIQ